ncbi:hypothetical protein CXG81DRAFT_27362 [Caulochytrium protostelioides]|uniref:Cullin family profile domain-containing protein n=1 Tax=Caulochytrium protostelioides TaxID=1555241 RepID=A0A4P9X4C2_9FUNG|nr:hypothetical protein CXG81DRAFT_27362 [Caulochytrium protostelioides]|eukprot:RKO99909.1 hypothetical protein CXG81DRAFT_27362 [Caulochytrium protostelioides]
MADAAAAAADDDAVITMQPRVFDGFGEVRPAKTCFPHSRVIVRPLVASTASHAPTLSISGFTGAATAPPDLAAQAWRRFDAALTALFDAADRGVGVDDAAARRPPPPPTESFQELSRLCEAVCLYHLGAPLHAQLVAFLQARVQRTRRRLLSWCQTQADDDDDHSNSNNNHLGGGLSDDTPMTDRPVDRRGDRLSPGAPAPSTPGSPPPAAAADPSLRVLHVITAAFDDWQRPLHLVCHVFAYLDRTYVLQTPGLQSLWDTGMALFRDAVLASKPLSDRLTRCFLAVVTARRVARLDRLGLAAADSAAATVAVAVAESELTAVDRYRHEQVRAAVMMAHAMCVYQAVLEAPLLARITPFYEARAQQWMQTIAAASADAGLSFGRASATRDVVRCAVAGSAATPASANEVRRYLAFVEHVHRMEQADASGDGRDNSPRSDRAGHGALLASSWPAIGARLDDALLAACLPRLLAFGLEVFAAQRDLASLEALYRAAHKTGQLPLLCDAYAAFVGKAGLQRLVDPQQDPTMVASLLALHRDAQRITTQAFHSRPLFIKATKDAFEQCLAKRPTKPAELVARYIDDLLRPNPRTDAAVDELLDECLTLFRFLSDKDVFEACYKKLLATRLLLDRSASVARERSMLGKLRRECGSGFTYQLDGMFKDMDESEVLMTAYQPLAPASAATAVAAATARGFASAGRKRRASARFSDDDDDHVDAQASRDDDDDNHDRDDISDHGRLTSPMRVQVLTAAYWPTYTPVAMVLPEPLHTWHAHFEAFYGSRHAKRCLTWHHPLGHGVLRAHYPRGTKDLLVSAFQAAVLLLFNEGDDWTVGALGDRLQLDAAELARAIQSLTGGPDRPLLMAPQTAAPAAPAAATATAEARASTPLPTSTRISFHAEFTHPRRRVHISTVPVKETEDAELEATAEHVFADRQHQVDAAIVRIMKKHRTLAHAALLTALLEELQFPVNPTDLKQRIESLIDREYMERVKGKRNVYHYVV